MTAYRTRPHPAEAIQWTGDNADEVRALTNRFAPVDPEDRGDDPDMTGQLLDSEHSAWIGVHNGQWIVRDHLGDVRRMEDGEFAETYEPLAETRWMHTCGYTATITAGSMWPASCPRCHAEGIWRAIVTVGGPQPAIVDPIDDRIMP